MKLPKHINLGGHEIRIEPQPGLAKLGECGHFEMGSLIIRIDTDMPETLVQETLLHEIVEAINALYELELAHRTIQILGTALHQALASEKRKK
jgi:hypothetical protein